VNVEWRLAFAEHQPCTIGAVGQENAVNVEGRLEFAKTIVVWCIGRMPSVQLGGQML
jgi:hypothetical protein